MTRRTEMSWRTRTAALVAGLAVAASVASVGAVAVPTAAFADTASVTITAQANTEAKYNVYQIFTAGIDGNNNATNVAWGQDVDADGLVTKLGEDYQTWLTENGHTDPDAATNAQNALEYISEQISASEGYGSHNPKWVDGSSFAAGFASWVAENVTPVGIATAGTEYSNEEGYYLFLTQGSSLDGDDVATAPIWFPLGGSAPSITEKATPPHLTKEVQEDSDSAWGEVADAEIGQEVSYRIDVTMPGNYDTFTEFYAQVYDTLPGGMSLDTGNVKVYVVNSGEDPVDVTNNFTIDFNNCVLTVTNANTMDDATDDSLSASSTLRVEYTARLDSLAGGEIVYGGAGNKNSAHFNFSNDPNATTHGRSNEDEAKLFVYQMDVDKVDQSTGEALAGAEFVIKNSAGYYLAETDGSWGWTTQSQGDAHVFTTGEDGSITGIKGLDEGTYTLVETKAPEGYVLPVGPAAETTIVVTRTIDAGGVKKLSGEITKGTATIDEGETNADVGTVGIDVENSKNIALAMTGAEGVGIGGAVVVAVGLGWYLVRRHRMSADEA